MFLIKRFLRKGLKKHKRYIIIDKNKNKNT